MADPLTVLRPYWEAWKSADPTDLKLRDGFIEICKALAGCSDAKAPSDALKAASELRDSSLEYLKTLDNFHESSHTVRLYRGVTDATANQLRQAIKNGTDYKDQPNVPISYSTDRGAALGFARKGIYCGVLFRSSVDLNDVVFVDREYYKEGNLQREAEVVICRFDPPAVTREDVLDERVEPQKRIYRNPASKEKAQQDRERLENEDRAS